MTRSSTRRKPYSVNMESQEILSSFQNHLSGSDPSVGPSSAIHEGRRLSFRLRAQTSWGLFRRSVHPVRRCAGVSQETEHCAVSRGRRSAHFRVLSQSCANLRRASMRVISATSKVSCDVAIDTQRTPKAKEVPNVHIFSVFRRQVICFDSVRSSFSEQRETADCRK